jgi:hypothetical protein
MVMITSVRAPLPVAELPVTPVADARQAGKPPVGASAAVAPPQMAQAVQQVPSKSGTTDRQFLDARSDTETSATQAAEAARAAYIQASIAAGINPLPVP